MERDGIVKGVLALPESAIAVEFARQPALRCFTEALRDPLGLLGAFVAGIFFFEASLTLGDFVASFGRTPSRFFTA